ncbi:hypothetical protein LTR78_007098 [Recurvomyces mirabilis]|uniref:F-box domain-containing protein n=1 Tax=Recurvomyces mirabilis TaxID=574656 RepID=A0AAE0WJR3_9PEZI|nr:hypothetical protein LTR78_007098 [Recurvomyces mirabilis]KAK5150931.1 hypothetical protein LTS14_009734 [Recurvomyces mirabilis]
MAPITRSTTNFGSTTNSSNIFNESAVLLLVLEHLPFMDLVRSRAVARIWKETIDQPSPPMRWTMFIAARPIQLVTVSIEPGSIVPPVPNYLLQGPQPSLHHGDALVGTPGATVVTAVHPLLDATSTILYHKATSFEIKPRELWMHFDHNTKNGFITQPPCKKAILLVTPTNEGGNLTLEIAKQEGIKLVDILDTIIAEVGDEPRQLDQYKITRVRGVVPGHVPDYSPWARGAQAKIGGMRYFGQICYRKVTGYEWKEIKSSGNVLPGGDMASHRRRWASDDMNV